MTKARKCHLEALRRSKWAGDAHCLHHGHSEGPLTPCTYVATIPRCWAISRWWLLGGVVCGPASARTATFSVVVSEPRCWCQTRAGRFSGLGGPLRSAARRIALGGSESDAPD